MALVQGFMGTGAAAAAGTLPQVGKASHSLESIMYNLTPTNTPLISHMGKEDQRAASQRFAIAKSIADDPVDRTSANTILQPVNIVSEHQAMEAPVPSFFGANQTFNVIQIITDSVGSTFMQDSVTDRLTPISAPPVASEGSPVSQLLDQLERKLEVMASKLERCALHNPYVEPVNPTTVAKTRGILTLMHSAEAQGNNINMPLDATAAQIKNALETLIVAMNDSGADFKDMALMCSGLTANKISAAFEAAPQTVLPPSRKLAGAFYNVIYTSVGAVPVVPSRYMLETDVLFVDYSKIGHVWLPSHGENIEIVPIAQKGAATQFMLYAQWGFDHGLWNHHGLITRTDTP